MKFVNNWLRAVFFSHSLLGVVIMMFLLAYCMKTLPNFEKIAFLYSACSFLYISNFLHWIYFKFGSLYFYFGLAVYFFFGCFFYVDALVIHTIV